MNYNFDILYSNLKNNLSNAYCPYSNFKVSAAAVFKSDKIFYGCNIENSSYSAGICGERSALCSAVSSGEKPCDLLCIAVLSYSDNNKFDLHKYCMPCGVCRQFISEFNTDADIICYNYLGEHIGYKLSDLFPHAFNL